MEDRRILWEPNPAQVRNGELARFMAAHGDGLGPDDGYEAVWRWSIDNLDQFWAGVVEHFDVALHHPYQQVRSGDTMAEVTWFDGAALNYAEHALRRADDGVALVGVSQSRPDVTWTWNDLHREVALLRRALEVTGVGVGDRVAAYLPNLPETVAAFLATASLGAVWSSCAPEFGVGAVLDRFGQIEPKVLLAVDGYRYGARLVDRRDEVRTIVDGLASLSTVVVLPYVDASADVADGMVRWDDFRRRGDATGVGVDPIEDRVTAVAFDHPLYVLYSSGTTGMPKAIVHGHGGILLEHLKVLGLQADIGPQDRVCWFTTTGWMMWNYLVSTLLRGAAVVLFDGDPGFPDVGALWRVVSDHRVTWFGAGAPYHMACAAAGERPGERFDLAALRAVGSTGAPLSPEAFEWIYEAVSADVELSSISGGTDVCSAFVGGSPWVPVRSGEISCRYLGASVAAFDEDGTEVVGRQGELVITRPMPSMPVAFWGDADGSAYRRAYFERFPGVWCHGDWITITERGSCVISGRSDATLNRGGVRVGTAEIYRVVNAVAGVGDSLVVHLDGPGRDRLVVLVEMPGLGDELDVRTVDAIRSAIRTRLSPRHVPDEIYRVDAVPMTLSGKKLEVPVKRILSGESADRVASRDSLKDPAALDAIVALAARLSQTLDER